MGNNQEIRPAKKWKIRRWWTFSYTIIVIISIILVVTQLIGSGGFRFRGASVNVDKRSDYQLFKIDEKYAIYSNPKYEDLDLVTYDEEKFFPFLGKYNIDSNLISKVYKDGDWYYSNIPGFIHKGYPLAFNSKSKQLIIKEEGISEDMKYIPENMKNTGLNLDESKKLTKAQLSQFPKLSVPKESAVTTFMVIIIIHIFWLILLPFAIKKVQI